jgi:hypothetical protein
MAPLKAIEQSAGRLLQGATDRPAEALKGSIRGVLESAGNGAPDPVPILLEGQLAGPELEPFQDSLVERLGDPVPGIFGDHPPGEEPATKLLRAINHQVMLGLPGPSGQG